MKQRNKAVPAVYLILKRGTEILLVKRANSGYYDGWYSLPAGHVEYRELPMDALIRECAEEIGITLKRGDFQFCHLLYREAHDETGDRADMFVVCENGEDYAPTNTEPEKCAELRWFNIKELPKNMVQNVRFAVEKALAGEVYSELDQATLDAFEEEYKQST